MEVAKAIIEQNRYWLFAREPDGTYRTDTDGNLLPTMAGELYLGFLREATANGAVAVAERHAYAMGRLRAAIRRANAGRPRGWVTVVSLRPGSTIIPDLTGLRVATITDNRDGLLVAREILRQNGLAVGDPPRTRMWSSSASGRGRLTR